MNPTSGLVPEVGFNLVKLADEILQTVFLFRLQAKLHFTLWKDNDTIISRKRYKGCEAMIIKPSAALRNDYSSISNLAKETKEPIYITKNGEGDLVLMSIYAFEKREQILQLRAKVLQAEQERISGAETLSVSEARRKLRERADEV